ncbi:MAG: leucine-rich repeat protein [Clostridia bacterium]|nr:leucine-rich repeat protein [Clostridia bacterium]
MKKFKVMMLLLLIMPCMLLFTACGGDSNNNENNVEDPIIEYSVRFLVNNELYENKEVQSGNKIKKPVDPTLENYSFIGWYNGEIEWDFETGVIESNLTLTAKFELNYYTVKFMVDNKVYDTKQVASGSKIEQPTGTIFKNCKVSWVYDFGVTWNFEREIQRDLILTAKFDYGYTYEGTKVTGLTTYGRTLTELNILEGMTEIGEKAFDNSSNTLSLKSIVIPSSVKTIGKSAFKSCNLTSVTFGDNSKLESIEDTAFYYCDNLTNIVIPSSVKKISQSAFLSCYKLVEVKNLSSLNIVAGSENNGYVGKYALRVYTSGESYLSTDENGFVTYNDETLVAYQGIKTEITIPNTIKIINSYAFSGYRNLTGIEIPDSVNSIGEGAFYGCWVKSITIPSGVTSISDDLFKSSIYLTSVYIPDSVTSIGEGAFCDCRKLTSITIPSSIKTIGKMAFLHSDVLTNINYNGTIADWCNIEFGDYSSNPMYYAEHFYLKSNNEYKEVKKLEIPETVTELKSYAFYGFNNISEIIVPNSVISIKESVFYKCSNLQKLTIPFVGSSETESDNLGYILGWGDSRPSIKEVIVTNGKTIGKQTFYYWKSLTSVTIPNTVESIDENAFKDCSGLISIVIPKSVTSVAFGAFAGCTSLSSITLPKVYTGKESFGEYFGYIFGTTSSYNSEYIPSSLKTVTLTNCTSIASMAFSCCSSLTRIVLPAGLTSIGISAFSACSSLSSITIPESVTSIGSNAFSGCKKLKYAYFRNTDNWKVSKFSDMSYSSNVFLYDTEKNAKYLTETYCNYNWKIVIPKIYI